MGVCRNATCGVFLYLLNLFSLFIAEGLKEGMIKLDCIITSVDYAGVSLYSLDLTVHLSPIAGRA